MTIKQFRALKPGCKLRWREGKDSPRAGELTDTGILIHDGPRHFIEWQDGQQTEELDDWALENVEVSNA